MVKGSSGGRAGSQAGSLTLSAGMEEAQSFFSTIGASPEYRARGEAAVQTMFSDVVAGTSRGVLCYGKPYDEMLNEGVEVRYYKTNWDKKKNENVTA